MFEEFKRIGRFLFQEGLVNSHGGNLSIREGDKIFITRRDAMLGDLKEKDIVGVGMERTEGDELVSREISTHRVIYRTTNALAIVHAHPAHAISISLTDNKIVPRDSEGLALFKSAPIIRVNEPVGSEEVARLLPPIFGSGYVVATLRGHGSFAVGKTLEEAYKYTSSLENSCKIIIAIRSSGGRPHLEKKIERRRPAIPPGIGVMDRERYRRR